MDEKTFECTVSMTYNAEDPIDAARQLIANIMANPGWYVKVREFDSGESVTVDTETGEIS